MRKKDPELMKRILEYVTEYYLNYSCESSVVAIIGYEIYGHTNKDGLWSQGSSDDAGSV